MPGKMNKTEESKWREAKRVVKRQTGKKYSDFTHRDWGLVQHIYKQKIASDIKSLTKLASDLDLLGEFELATLIDNLTEQL